MDQNLSIINKKLEVTFSRSRKQVTDWLNAYILAEAPNYPRRKELMDVYDYGLLDNHLSAVVENRKNKILGEPFRLVDRNNAPLQKETLLLKRSWFRDFIDHSLDAIFFGYSLIELGDLVNGEITNVTLVSRRNTHPERREVLIRPSDISGISFDDPIYANNYVLVQGHNKLGLLLGAMPNVIYKRFALAAWTEHAEKFSIPFIHAKTNRNDSDAVAKLEKTLIEAGREMIAVTDHGDELQVLQTGSSDAFNIYDKLTERVNSEISKLIVGQTMTTDSGSSLSQAKVHDKTGGEIAEADREFIEIIINDHLLPRLRKFGYPIPDDARFEYTLQQEKSIEEQVKIYDLLLKHYNLDPSEIKNAFGVRVEKNGLTANKKRSGI